MSSPSGDPQFDIEDFGEEPNEGRPSLRDQAVATLRFCIANSIPQTDAVNWCGRFKVSEAELNSLWTTLGGT